MKTLIIFVITTLLSGCYSYNTSTMPCDYARKQFGVGNESIVIKELNTYDNGCQVRIRH